MWSARCFCPILTKFGFSRQILIEVPNIKFHENSSSGSRADACGCTNGLTDGNVEAKRRYSKLIRRRLKTDTTTKTCPEEWNKRTCNQSYFCRWHWPWRQHKVETHLSYNINSNCDKTQLQRCNKHNLLKYVTQQKCLATACAANKRQLERCRKF
jgi:hypothetical protein